MLQIYNTLTKQKESFKPLNPPKVGMYVCGMTVYDYCHIGHGRIFVVFDVIARYLRFLDYKLTYVRNITDIDDKIIKRANENGESIFSLTERTIQAMYEDEAALGVMAPDIVPQATQHIPEMIKMIQDLIEKKYAYVAPNGDVYYDVDRFENYGELAHQKLDKLQAGHRVELVDVKRNPLDFVLWKLSKPDEPKWDSPWGPGRPGWHIECSAMATKYLGQPFDIHGGGLDLVFPHHQNEIAQAEAANDCKFVDTWIHVGYVQIDAEKMSKSLGNFLLIREVLKNYDAEVIRYFMIASHYRSPINYSDENLKSAHSALERFYGSLRGLSIPEKRIINEKNKHFEKKFVEAMNDDFNTPEALAVLFEMVYEINCLRDNNEIKEAEELASQLKFLSHVLGILRSDPEDFLKSGINKEELARIENLIEKRYEARRNKDWKEADRIRHELIQMGIALEDIAAGKTIWRKL